MLEYSRVADASRRPLPRRQLGNLSGSASAEKTPICPIGGRFESGRWTDKIGSYGLATREWGCVTGQRHLLISALRRGQLTMATGASLRAWIKLRDQHPPRRGDRVPRCRSALAWVRGRALTWSSCRSSAGFTLSRGRERSQEWANRGAEYGGERASLGRNAGQDRSQDIATFTDTLEPTRKL